MTTSTAPPGGSATLPAASRLARALPLPAGAGLARLLVERNALAFRRGWITLVSGFFEPVFYLFSLGIGLGRLVGDVTVAPGHTVPYAVFVAPALMAASAMNGAVYDSTFNIFFKLKFARLYDSVLSTPLGPRDVAVGEIGWALIRGLMYSTAFLLVMLVTGLARSWWALLAIPAASLIGLGFAAVGMAATTFMRSWVDFDYVQLAVLPMFLFSATFYPLATYPEPIRTVVQVLPLYHAVAIERGLLLGEVEPVLLVHAGVLAAMGLVGVIVAARRLERLLLT